MTTATADVAAWGTALEQSPRSTDLPGWLQARKREAREHFESKGFPAARDEAWRFTNVTPISATSFERADTETAVDVARLPCLDPAEGTALPRMVIVNGRLRRELSAAPPPGVRVLHLADALPVAGQTLEARLGSLADPGSHPFAALNGALWTDLVVVLIEPRAVVRQPVHLCFVATGGPQESPARNHPRVLVVAARHSQATLVTSHVGADVGHYFSNPVAEIALEEGAILDLVRDQRESSVALHVGHVVVEQARDSRFRDFSLSLGGRLVRHELSVRLAAEGAECELLGLFVGAGSQHLDTHSLVDHAAPHTTSRELYKGILGGHARGVFHGHVLVRRDAQKIDAEQTNRNLLLTRNALVNSTPALEIRADDVKCRHGSTTGQLDDLAVFYLRSRGLDEAAAHALLTRAFAGDVTARVPLEALRAHVEAHVDRLAGEALR